MRTVTEFDGFLLNRALNAKKELVAAGKAPEELPAAMGEALKVEGDKLTMLLHALEVVDGRTDKLKRVIVYALNEGEAAPSGTVAKGDKQMLAEYFYTPAPKQQERGRGGPRDGKRGGRGGRGGKGKGRGDRDRGRSGPGGGGERRDAKPGEERKDRKPRPPRGPRTDKPKSAESATNAEAAKSEEQTKA